MRKKFTYFFPVFINYSTFITLLIHLILAAMSFLVNDSPPIFLSFSCTSPFPSFQSVLCILLPTATFPYPLLVSSFHLHSFRDSFLFSSIPRLSFVFTLIRILFLLLIFNLFVRNDCVYLLNHIFKILKKDAITRR